MELLFYPFMLLITIPGGGLLPGVVLLYILLRRRSLLSRFHRGLALLCVISWLIYGLYETRMYFWMQTVSAPIRADLLLIAPFLGGLTLWTVVALVRSGRQSRGERSLSSSEG